MSFFEQVALGWQALLRTVARVGKPGPWAPLAILGACELAAIALLAWFAHPAVSWFMAPLLRRAGGAELLHYPNVLRALPGLYGRVDVVLGATVGAVAVGAATRIFANQLRGRPEGVVAALGAAARRAVALVVVGLPFNLLVFALTSGLGWLIAHRQSGGLVHRLSDFIVLAGSVVFQSLFFYVTCDVMLAGRGVLAALRDVPHAAARGFWAALVIGTLLALPLLPLQLLAAQSARLVDRGAPELVAWLMAAEAAASLLLWFALAGSATLVYLTAVNPDDGAEP